MHLKEGFRNVPWRLIIPLAFALGIVIWQWEVFYTLLSGLMLAIILAYILNLAVKPLEKFIPRGWALLLVMFALVALLALTLVAVLPRALREARQLIDLLPQYMGQLLDMVSKLEQQLAATGIHVSLEGTKQSIANWVTQLGDRPPQQQNSMPSITAHLPSLALAPVLAAYFIKDREYFAELLLYIVPFRYRMPLRRFGREMDRVLARFLRGQVSISIIVGLLAMLGFWLAGTPYFWLMGLLTGLFNLIPYIGPFLAAVPVLLATLPEGGTQILLALGVCVVVQQIDNNFLTPKIMGDTLGLHPVVLILSLIVFGGVFGFVGLLLAMPMLLFVKTLGSTILAAQIREQGQPADPAPAEPSGG